MACRASRQRRPSTGGPSSLDTPLRLPGACSGSSPCRSGESWIKPHYIGTVLKYGTDSHTFGWRVLNVLPTLYGRPSPRIQRGDGPRVEATRSSDGRPVRGAHRRTGGILTPSLERGTPTVVLGISG